MGTETISRSIEMTITKGIIGLEYSKIGVIENYYTILSNELVHLQA